MTQASPEGIADGRQTRAKKTALWGGFFFG